MPTEDIKAIQPNTCIVRNTAAARGRTRSVTPETTAMRHLYYGRIVLQRGDAAIRVETGPLETGLVGLKGTAAVTVAGTTYRLTRYDALYVPRESTFEVRADDDSCDLAEVSAPVDRKYPVQFVAYADVQKDPGLHFDTGTPGSRRSVNILLGKNVQAGRIMAGVTFSEPGNWTSWPPHEHAALAEEAYLYIDMPAPGFGLQLVFTDAKNPELATIVREGDVVLMPRGYHPNVAVPGHPINFLWMMAANRELDDRLYGVVNVHPDFSTIGSGLDAGRAR
jgi:5-deoxy-glucuronate isomerase